MKRPRKRQMKLGARLVLVVCQACEWREVVALPKGRDVWMECPECGEPEGKPQKGRVMKRGCAMKGCPKGCTCGGKGTCAKCKAIRRAQAAKGLAKKAGGPPLPPWKSG